MISIVFYIDTEFFSTLRKVGGKVAEWLKATDCKSVEIFLRRFESCLSQKNNSRIAK